MSRHARLAVSMTAHSTERSVVPSSFQASDIDITELRVVTCGVGPL